MYDLVVRKNIEEVKSVFWELNQNTYSVLYRSKSWLTDSQKRLGDIDIYIEVYKDNKPVILFPIVVFNKRSDYPPVDPHKIVEQALQKRIDEPVAMCASFFGLGCAVIVNEKEIVDWEFIFNKLSRLVRKEYNCSHIVFAYQSIKDDPWVKDSSAKNVLIKVPHKEFGLLDLKKFSNYEDYLRSFTSKQRNNFRREENLIVRNGVVALRKHILDLDLDTVGILASNVFRKYGNEVSPNRLSSFAKYIAEQFPAASGCFTCWKDGVLLSYALYIEYSGVLYIKMLGRDYELDKYQSYFHVCYHQPIQYAFERGIRYLDYGSGASATKVKRGIEMVESYSYTLFKGDIL
ncbi:GNAT family N-acetyltransferase [Anoxybacteroides tepidamans]|uniref:GNAT family N-acetyltransferase n=1 Tax=Anoxybacteroides tepidamans TaxID=265948 RepID=UPI000489D631|nr:GNAT family N-acetyltransferase [Anoxybacillus tepidamans]